MNSKAELRTHFDTTESVSMKNNGSSIVARISNSETKISFGQSVESRLQ